MLDCSTIAGPIIFQMLKWFMTQFVPNLDIESGNTRIGIISFATSVETHIPLDKYSSLAALQTAISLLRYCGGQSNTAGALRYVRTEMLTPQRGDRSDVPNVIVLTYGISDDPAAAQVSRACSEV